MIQRLLTIVRCVLVVLGLVLGLTGHQFAMAAMPDGGMHALPAAHDHAPHAGHAAPCPDFGCEFEAEGLLECCPVGHCLTAIAPASPDPSAAPARRRADAPYTKHLTAVSVRGPDRPPKYAFVC